MASLDKRFRRVLGLDSWGVPNALGWGGGHKGGMFSRRRRHATGGHGRRRTAKGTYRKRKG